jgi:hypothetical protein
MIDRSWSATGSALIPSGKHISLSFWLSGFLSLSSVLLPVFILIPQPRYAPFSSPFPSLPLLSSPTGRTSSPPPNPTQPSTRPLTTTSNAPSPTKLNCKGGRIWASSGWGWRRFRRRSTRLGWGGSSSRGGGPGEWCRSWDGYAVFFFFFRYYISKEFFPKTFLSSSEVRDSAKSELIVALTSTMLLLPRQLLLCSRSISTSSLRFFAAATDSVKPLKVAIIGAGPSGFYSASRILSQLPPDSPQGRATEVHLYERLPTPHGLVRYGVAPDHPDVKVR